MVKPSHESPHERLHRGSVRGLLVSSGGQGVRLLIASGQVIVLSRLLSPEVFGLFGMTWAVLALIYNSRDLGIAAAVVQRPDASPQFLNAAFWLSLASGLLLAAVVALLGYPLSLVYGEPEVLEIAVKFAPLFLVSGVSAHFQAVMRREMRYMSLNVLLTIAQVIGTGGAIALAYAGWGVDSLIFMLMGQEIAAMLLAPLFCRWRPSRPSLAGEGRRLASFGGDLSIYRLLQNLAAGMDHIALGLFTSPEVVGLYNRASTLFATPRRQVLTPFGQVVPTLLSRLQDDADAFGRTACRLLNAVGYLWFPYLALLAAAPGTALQVVLGPQWSDAAALLPIIALGEVTRLHLLLLNMAETQLGRTRSLRNFGLVSGPIVAGALIAGASQGLETMVEAYAAAQVGVFVLRIIQVNRVTPLATGLVLRSLASPFLLGLLLLAAFKGAALLGAELQPVPRLGAVLLCGAAALLLYLLAWPAGRRDARMFVRTLGNLRSPR